MLERKNDSSHWIPSPLRLWSHQINPCTLYPTIANLLTVHSANGAHFVGESVLFSVCFNCLSAAVGLHLEGTGCPSTWSPSGNLSSVSTGSLHRQGLNCLSLAPGAQVRHAIPDVVFCGHSFDISKKSRWLTAQNIRGPDSLVTLKNLF